MSRLAFRIIGIPHIGLRLRAGLIINEIGEKPMRILDAGCGYGILSLTLARQGHKVYCIDNDEEKISFLRGRELNPEVMDIRSLGFKDEFFDVVICTDVLEHVEDNELAFSEMKRVLKKEGRLLFTAPSLSEDNEKNYMIYGHLIPGYNEEQIRGLTDLKIEKKILYASPVLESAFKINKRLYKSKILLGLCFYPLYLLALLERVVKFRKERYNGLFLVFRKNS